MQDEIVSYLDMCARERMSLQRGMNYRQPPACSVVLMSRRPGALYQDELSDDGAVLIYEGHDARRDSELNPKSVDQPLRLPSGRFTENGIFADATTREPKSKVRVYEKLRDGIWSDRGLFELAAYDFVFKQTEI